MDTITVLEVTHAPMYSSHTKKVSILTLEKLQITKICVCSAMQLYVSVIQSIIWQHVKCLLQHIDVSRALA